MSQDANLDHLLFAFCTRHGLDGTWAKLVFDGDDVLLGQTPRDLRLEDGFGLQVRGSPHILHLV
eukprot:2310625-Prymnesium_polylepis.1